jgi:hypothetical protein
MELSRDDSVEASHAVFAVGGIMALTFAIILMAISLHT